MMGILVCQFSGLVEEEGGIVSGELLGWGDGFEDECFRGTKKRPVLLAGGAFERFGVIVVVRHSWLRQVG